jgi:hypothetical protein
MSDQLDLAEMQGAFPLAGPVPYIVDDVPSARLLLAAPELPAESTWWHVTYPDNLASVLAIGLTPSCWWGGDTCAVFGIDSRANVPTWRSDDWVLEINTCALEDDAKAWWVPASRIRGAWRQNRFFTRAQLIAPAHSHRDQTLRVTDGCRCSLSPICHQQQSAWRATWD